MYVFGETAHVPTCKIIIRVAKRFETASNDVMQLFLTPAFLAPFRNAEEKTAASRFAALLYHFAGLCWSAMMC
jgi:hypothetical protein